MKNLLKLSILLFSLASGITTYAQQINIGDQCPDVTLSMLNYKTPTVKISDFRGKLLILDFWATWCGPCVRMIPKTDTLQNQFEGRAAIIPVAYEDEKTVRVFYEGYNKYHHILPYTAVNDAELKRLFKPNELPHYVWIDSDGKVIAITDWEDITALNIINVLNGQPMHLKQKKLNYTFDVHGPFFTAVTPVIDSGGVNKLDIVPEDSILYHSILTKYRPGFPQTERVKDSARISCFNCSIKTLYKAGLGKFQQDYLFDNLVRVETKDSMLVQCRLIGTPYKNWVQLHTYCYELVVPHALGGQWTDLMVADLNRYFGPVMGIEGVLEKRMVKCLVLTRTVPEDRIAAVDDHSYAHESTRYHYKIHAHMYTFIEDLEMDLQTITTPLVDGTDYKGVINIELNCNMNDIHEINKALAPYGLQFIEKDYARNIVVIRDKEKAGN